MNTTMIDKTVGALVSERPGRSRVFEKYGIDFCCGGKIPLAEACTTGGADAEEILRELAQSDADALGEDDVDYTTLKLDELVEHIVSTHHAYLRRELPRCLEMALKVAAVHGDKDERLRELARVVGALAEELSEHMMKEERVLFPAICQLAGTDSPLEMIPGMLGDPIRALEAEHDNAGNALSRMSELTENYTPPDWACNTYRALLGGLNDLELDLHLHIHKENNILFPKALELEKSRG